MTIQWFPGHMAKAHRMIRENIKLVDVVVELLDARVPLSSANPVINEVVEGKPRVIALNKADLANRSTTQEWLKYYKSLGITAVAIDSGNGKGVKELVHAVENATRDKFAVLAAKGINRSIRAMILGIPNVGKSTLINRLVGSAVAKTGDKPGVTRGKQWIRIGKNLELLDTPGVLWPKFENPNVAYKLAITGAINDDIYDMEKVVSYLLKLMSTEYSDRLVERYKLKPPIPEDSDAILELIAARRGCLRAGGVTDREKTMRIIINEFRAGKLGVFTLDKPGNDEEEIQP